MNVRGITWESGLKISREKIYLKWEGGEERGGGEQTPGERDKTERWWQEEVKRKLSIQPNSGETVTTWNKLIMHTRSAESWIMLQGWIDIYGSPEGPSGKCILWWSKLFSLLCVCDLRAGEEKFCQDNLSFLFHLWNLKKRKKNSAEKNIFCHFFQDKTMIFHIFTKIKELIKIISIQYKSFVIALLEK